jgi:hypothetical protein
MGLFKSVWKVASTVATIITIKNQLNVLSKAPEELKAMAKDVGIDVNIPTMNSIVAGDYQMPTKFDQVVKPMASSQLTQIKTGV